MPVWGKQDYNHASCGKSSGALLDPQFAAYPGPLLRLVAERGGGERQGIQPADASVI
jgi:hypothetical protein